MSEMKINNKGELVIGEFDIDQVIGWFVDGDTLQEAVERELHHAGLEGKWEFDANKIIYEE